MPQIEAIDLNKARELVPVDTNYPKILEKAEQTQSQVRIPSDSLKDDNHLKGIPSDLNAKRLALVDAICKEVGHESLSRMILRLTGRVAEVAEQHILQRRYRQRVKKDEIAGKVEQQKSLKMKQASTHGFGGFGTAALALVTLLPEPLGPLAQNLMRLPEQIVQIIATKTDGKIIPLQHETSLFLQMTSSERQAIESLKNLPEQLRNLILELMRLELRAVESISQR
jgi:hypothetical protein